MPAKKKRSVQHANFMANFDIQLRPIRIDPIEFIHQFQQVRTGTYKAGEQR